MRCDYTGLYYKNTRSDVRIISLNLSGGVAYIGRMKKLLLLFISILVGILLLTMPVSALIQQSVSSTFDGTGQTPAYGEEIASTLVLSAGDSDIKDLTINFKNADAFIDFASFKKEINPAGALVNITPTADGFYIENLPKGPVVTITFNAYPKTTQSDTLHVADIGFTYTQLGQQFEPSLATPATPVTADLKSSSYHSLKAEESNNFWNNNALIIGAFLSAVAIIALVIYIVKKREYAHEIIKMQEDRIQLLNDIYRKLELAENNPAEFDSLKLKIRNEMGVHKSSIQDKHSGSSEKSEKREIKGGFE